MEGASDHKGGSSLSTKSVSFPKVRAKSAGRAKKCPPTFQKGLRKVRELELSSGTLSTCSYPFRRGGGIRPCGPFSSGEGPTVKVLVLLGG